MNAIFFSFLRLPIFPPSLSSSEREQEALHHPDRRRKRREGERKRDCDGGIKGYPSLSVTSFIVPCSVLPAHPSSAVTHSHIHKKIETHTFHPFSHTRHQPRQTHTHARIKDWPSDMNTQYSDSLSALFHTFKMMTHRHNAPFHTHEHTLCTLFRTIGDNRHTN